MSENIVTKMPSEPVGGTQKLQRVTSRPRYLKLACCGPGRFDTEIDVCGAISPTPRRRSEERDTNAVGGGHNKITRRRRVERGAAASVTRRANEHRRRRGGKHEVRKKQRSRKREGARAAD